MIAGTRALLAVGVVTAVVAAGWLMPPRERAAAEHPPQRVARPGPVDPPAHALAPGPAPPAMTAASVPAPLAPAVMLTGVAVGADARNLALVSIDRRPEVLLRVGDAMTASATVVHIDDTSMTYRQAGVDVRLAVKPARAAAAAVAQAAAPPTTYPGFMADAPPMARVNGREPGSGNDAFRQAIDKKLQSIAANR